MSDLEDIIQILSVRDTNPGISLISSTKGVVIVGYTLLNSLIKVTLSFDKLSSFNSDFVSQVPSSQSFLQLANFTYDTLSINGMITFSSSFKAELAECNPRVLGIMDFLRLRLNNLLSDFRNEVISNGHTSTHSNPVYDILKKLLVLDLLSINSSDLWTRSTPCILWKRAQVPCKNKRVLLIMMTH